jgi:hypothetical protein
MRRRPAAPRDGNGAGALLPDLIGESGLIEKTVRNIAIEGIERPETHEKNPRTHSLDLHS